MYQQTEIDYCSRPQNSIENALILDSCKDKLNNQCKVLLQALQSGNRLTVKDGIMYYGIGDLRARVRDLIDKGYDIKKETLKGGFKKYWI